MQLYLVNWKFETAEDQLFATKEFCRYLSEGKFAHNIDGFELNTFLHTPQDGTGLIICKAKDATTMFKIFNMWRENFGISFTYKPALTNEELLQASNDNQFW